MNTNIPITQLDQVRGDDWRDGGAYGATIPLVPILPTVVAKTSNIEKLGSDLVGLDGFRSIVG